MTRRQTNHAGRNQAGSISVNSAEASKRVSSNKRRVSTKCVSGLAAFGGGAKNNDVRSLAAGCMPPFHLRVLPKVLRATKNPHTLYC